MRTSFSLLLFFLFALTVHLTTSASQVPLRVGAERTELYVPLLQGKRVGLVVNHTALMGNTSRHLADSLLALGIDVRTIFAPEHGFRGKADAGALLADGRDTATGIPIASLYGKNKQPTAEQMSVLDVMVFDIQDVGARFYTYISTLWYVMEACARQRVPLVVLDRPNPADFIDGPVLEPEFKSFVGMWPIPVLHGCTVGELARMAAGEHWVDSSERPLQLTVIPVEGWRHGQPYSLPIPPSPNLPDDQSVALYASLCPFEATNISVGRGTPFPFKVAGGAYKAYGTFYFIPHPTPGSDLNPVRKHKKCYGWDLRESEPPQGMTLQYLLHFYRKTPHPEKFFSRPRWMDLLMGTDKVRRAIMQNDDEQTIKATWQPQIKAYKKMRKPYLLYPDRAY